MTPQLLVAREARADIAETIAAFSDISPTLSGRFGVELERVYRSILDYPQMYPLVHKKFRRAILRRFPYSVFYIVDESLVLIVAVIHQSRDESSWKRRA